MDDLVVYNENGSLTFIGRKEAQVEVHGQRVKFGDVKNYGILHHSAKYDNRHAYCLRLVFAPIHWSV